MKKRILTIALILVLVLSLGVFLSSCGKQKLLIGKEYIAATNQISVLTELKAKTVDVGVMDSTLANYYTSAAGSFNDLMVLDIDFGSEEYGIAAKKGAINLIDEVWAQIVALKADGTLEEIAERYGLESDLIVPDTFTKRESSDTSLSSKTKLKVGYTEFQPISYPDPETKELVGFDTDLARAVAANMELEIEFVLIEWSKKEIEIKSNKIDLIWNGMTINDERKAEFEMSAGYLKNQQVAVIRKADKDIYKTTKDMANAIMSAEAGSAGEDVIIKK